MPTAFLADRLARRPLPAADGVAAFLDRNRDFDIVGTVVAKYLDERPEAVAGLPDPDRVVANLASVQRVYQVTPRLARTAATQALLDRGIASAAQIVHMGLDGFVDTHAAALEDLHPQLDGKALAATVFERARRRHAFSVTMMSQLGASFNTVAMLGVPTLTFDLVGPGMATLRELFGSLDYCACEHCRSVFGPAAYLVDLLAFLESRPALAAGQTALDVLRSRRADLTGIELSCANTNTELPYLDLVLEILEQAVADPDAPLVAHQTSWSDAELRVAAEHHDASAYDAVADAVYPWTLPFALSIERMRAYTAQLGVPRPEAMRVFALDPTAAAPDLVAESLAMSREELQLISGATAFPPVTDPGDPGARRVGDDRRRLGRDAGRRRGPDPGTQPAVL